MIHKEKPTCGRPMLMAACHCLWLLTVACGCLWPVLAAHACSWLLMIGYGCLCLLLAAHDLYNLFTDIIMGFVASGFHLFGPGGRVKGEEWLPGVLV